MTPRHIFDDIGHGLDRLPLPHPLTRTDDRGEESSEDSSLGSPAFRDMILDGHFEILDHARSLGIREAFGGSFCNAVCRIF